MTDAIYLIQNDGQIIDMRVQPYESENLLQALIARYPSALAGDQMNPTAPRRWLLVAREATVPSEEGGADRWYVDHLFLDQDAIPTLVEVKRSSDTRIRREVIGQMLDYASNAVVYWPVETIRARFEATCELEGQDALQQLRTFLGETLDPEQFWSTAKTNLQAGRVRMVFLADAIPPELRRVVEFLNGQMDPAEVIAVEVKQYVGSGLKALVPRVLGQTAEAQTRKTVAAHESQQWDVESFLQALTERRGDSSAGVARQLLDWAERQHLRVSWGRGAQDGSFFVSVDQAGQTQPLISVWTYGRLEVQFETLKRRPPFEDETLRMELRDRLDAIPGVSLPVDGIGRRPSVPLNQFQDSNALQMLEESLEWATARIKAAAA